MHRIGFANLKVSGCVAYGEAAASMARGIARASIKCCERGVVRVEVYEVPSRCTARGRCEIRDQERQTVLTLTR